MNYEITEATQSAINPGAVKDIYYYGETNLSKQAFPVVKNNRFKQQLPNMGAGTSQVVISPNMGVSDVVLRVQMPVAAGAITYTDASLPTGWGYSLIKTVSVRYGGSSQYFWQGSQILAQNLLDCENQTKAEALLTLGGQFQTGNGCSGAEALLYINLPHNSPRAEGKPLPLCSDLLTQPIVLTIEMVSPDSVFAGSNGNAPSGLPTQLAAAEVQVNQEYMSDSADLLARRVDMNSSAISYPLKYFAQQEILNTIQGVSGGDFSGQQNIVLTGFRSGEVRDIMMWLEVQQPGQNLGSSTQFVWYPIQNAELKYNGEVFFTASGNAAQLWNLVEDKKIPGFNTTVLDPAPSPATATQTLSTWTLVKFSQVDVPRDRMYDLVSGKPILNAVINFSYYLPPAVQTLLSASSSNRAVLHAVYFYNSSLLFSRGTTEYIF